MLPHGRSTFLRLSERGRGKVGVFAYFSRADHTVQAIALPRAYVAARDGAQM